MNKIYCIFDKKTSTYLPPTVHVNDAEAVRALDNALTRGSDTLLINYPDDYALYSVGIFNSCPSPSESEVKDEFGLQGPFIIEGENPPLFVTELSSLPCFAKREK